MQTYATGLKNATVSREGGTVSKADRWTQLQRFLVIGSLGNYYADAKDNTTEAIGVIKACLDEDMARALTLVETVSKEGRAPKNDPAIVALSIALRHPDVAVRQWAETIFNDVCRTGTHMLHAFSAVQALAPKTLTGSAKVSNRLLRRTFANWFTSKDGDELALQAIKYMQRDGVSLADVLRISHPRPLSGSSQQEIFKWIVDGKGETKSGNILIDARDTMYSLDYTKDVSTAANLIRVAGLPREAVPTEFLNSIDVWYSLLIQGKYGMPLNALIRNLGKMTSVGLFNDPGDALTFVVNRLGDKEALKYARVHPISLLMALKVYQSGRGVRGSLTWTPVKKIVNALDEAFYLAFGAVEPTNQRLLLSVDVSKSMTHGMIGDTFNLTARDVAAALALVTMNTESKADIVGFSDRIVDLPISPTMRMDEVLRLIEKAPHGYTFASLPIQYANKTNTEYDAIVSLTDSQTADYPSPWHRHPYGYDAFKSLRVAPEHHVSVWDALTDYRKKYDHPVRHVVVGMATNAFTINNPDDPYGLDVVGMDASVPAVISTFIAGGA